MQHFKLFFLVLPSLLYLESFGNTISKSSVFFCYGKLNPIEIKGYDYVILESKHYNASDIKKFKRQNGKVFAYISVGEVNSKSRLYEQLKNNTLGKNENWDSYYLDLKIESTRSILFLEMERLLSEGYDGLFLDNIDNFSTFGFQKNDKEYIISFLKEMNSKYPNHYFIQNSGIDLLSETFGFVDAVVVESVVTNYTFSDNVYRLRETTEYNEYIKKLNLLKRKYKLPIILVEYADTKALYNQIIERISKTNFLYFVGNIDLQRIPNF